MTLEQVILIISKGFFKNSLTGKLDPYIWSHLRRFELVVVAVSIVDVLGSFKGVNIKYVKVVRSLMVIRFFQYWSDMIPQKQIMQVFGLITIFFIFMAINGVLVLRSV